MSSCAKPGCTVTTGLQRCSACKTALYCSKECQRVGWQLGHHIECKTIAANGNDGKGTKRKPESDEEKRKTDAEAVQRRLALVGLMQRMRLVLLTVQAELNDLRVNPPQLRPEDFMYKLQQIQSSAERALELALRIKNKPVAATLVPIDTYSVVLENAEMVVKRLSDRLNTTSAPDDFTEQEVKGISDAVKELVRRVRGILLNPTVWLDRSRGDSRLRSLPEDIVRLLAQKQRVLQLDVSSFPRDRSTWTTTRVPVPDDIPKSASDEVHPPVVSEDTVYRFFEREVEIADLTGKKVVNYPSIQTTQFAVSAATAAANAALDDAVFFAGLHGTLWEVGAGTAANFRYYDFGWHLIQSVDLPKLGRRGRAVGVDKDNRLWMVQASPPMIGMLRTDKHERHPTFVSWDLPTHYEQLYSPVVTGLGLVAMVLGRGRGNASKTGLVAFTVGDDNNHNMQVLRQSSQAVQLANARDLTDADMEDPAIGDYQLSEVSLAGDRISAQISVLDNENKLLHVHNLTTQNTVTYAYALSAAFASSQLMSFCMGNDGRSYLVQYQDVQLANGTRNFTPQTFRMEVRLSSGRT